MKNFKMTADKWLMSWVIIYIISGIVSIFVFKLVGEDSIVLYIQGVWIFLTSLPIWVKPIARWCNMRTFWE